MRKNQLLTPAATNSYSTALWNWSSNIIPAIEAVKFYADKLCLTPNYLSGVVKDYTGKTATEWVNEFVILEAKIMLTDSELSIQEIAYQLHFTDQSAFGKYFKQLVGISPKLYRSKK